MRKASLASRLAWRWMGFASLLSIILVGCAFVAAWMVEDRMINQRLLEGIAAAGMEQGGITHQPGRITLYDEGDAPLDIAAKVGAEASGQVVEFRRPNGRYVHAVASGDRPTARRVVVYDATDALVVGPNLATGLSFAGAFGVFVIVLAGLLAHLFARGVGQQAADLLEDLQNSKAPADVMVLAERQEVTEFREFLTLYAAVWGKQVSALEGEQQTLAYLAHELRTPLQSAQNSLAVLMDRPSDAASLARLERAIARLRRASNAALWLASERTVSRHEIADIDAIVTDLSEELRPLLDRAGVELVRINGPVPEQIGPREAVEAVIASLLQNALQHSGKGVVELRTGTSQISLSNPLKAATSEGFGLGLDLARRLCSRFGWKLEAVRSRQCFTATIHFLVAAESG